MLDLRTQRILVTGGAGFLGRAVVAALLGRGVAPTDTVVARQADYDLTRQPAAERLLADAFPGLGATLIIHCAGFVGGLGANRNHPGRFFHDNLAMGLHLIEAARRSGFVERTGTFVQIGTMCSYGSDARQPYREEDLFRGLPDADFAPYGIAKLALLQMLDAYRLQYGLRSACLIPTNLYGPGNNLDPEMSHAAGALIRRFVEASDNGQTEVVCWGTGSPLREFLYVDDAAEGIVRAAEVFGDSDPAALQAALAQEHSLGGSVGGTVPINLAPGAPASIRELAETIARLSGFHGRIVWNTSKGDGVPRRCLDAGRAHRVLGWQPRIPLEEGLARTIRWFRDSRQTAP
jgi:GDP-L-fucose synthase